MSERSNPAVLSEGRVAGARRELANATTLPPEAFTSEAVYQAEVERIFARSWLCAGRADQIPDAGDYFTLDLLDDKLVVVRGTDGEIRVLSRVCRHRAAELVRGSGNTRSFQCPYHAWTYRLDGSLSGAPFMEGVEGFDRKACGLPEIRSELWEGWIFVNFDREAKPLADQLAPLSKLLANYSMSEMVAVETATFDSPFNWKVLVDNFMEAYHHIGTHLDTFEPIFPASLSHAPDNDGPYSVLVMPGKSEQSDEEVASPGELPRVGELDSDEENRLVAAVVYPFHLFAPSAELLSWYQILPETYDRFTLRIFSCFPRKTLEDPAHSDAVRGLQEFTKVVHGQDIGACEAVWSGLNARSFEAGRLSLLEKPIWQFNQWWLERMAGATTGEDDGHR
jgi:phenylpropionate dioxygenase-like ring-hydroxylating dioxygenase large terminal subunit